MARAAMRALLLLPMLLAALAMGAEHPRVLYQLSYPAPGSAIARVRIDLPGPPGKRFDYLVIDYDDGWLFSAHLAANQTYVIDLKSNEVLHTISNTPGAEGLEYVPDQRKVYTSNAGDNTVGVID